MEIDHINTRDMRQARSPIHESMTMLEIQLGQPKHIQTNSGLKHDKRIQENNKNNIQRSKNKKENCINTEILEYVISYV